VAGVVLAVVAAFIVITAADTGGCLDTQTALGNRMTSLHNAFAQVYNRDFKAIDACTTVDCEKVPKLEIAASLKTYSDALGTICWPNRYKADAAALIQANTAMANAFTDWATATTPAEDQALHSTAKVQDTRQGSVDDRLSNELGVPPATPGPS